MVTVLSIDGGGIRGVIPALFLAEIEKRAGRPISDLFDMVAGTSTGGILTAMLCVPDGKGRPKYTAQEIFDAHFEHGGGIFHRSFACSVATLGGFARPSYSPRKLEEMLDVFLGDARLHQTRTDVLITAYDMATSTPWFFKTPFAKAHRGPADDPLLTQVARATSAAPTYFPPLELEGHCMVDGGVFASNPAICAFAEAKKMYPQEREFLVVSLGTGVLSHDRPCAQVSKWGIAGWAIPISSVMLNASSATVDYQLRAMLSGEAYVRFQVQLEKEHAQMDDASRANMQALKALAEQEVQKEASTLDWLCRKLRYAGGVRKRF